MGLIPEHVPAPSLSQEGKGTEPCSGGKSSERKFYETSTVRGKFPRRVKAFYIKQRAQRMWPRMKLEWPRQGSPIPLRLCAPPSPTSTYFFSFVLAPLRIRSCILKILLPFYPLGVTIYNPLAMSSPSPLDFSSPRPCAPMPSHRRIHRGRACGCWRIRGRHHRRACRRNDAGVLRRGGGRDVRGCCLCSGGGLCRGL